MHDQQGLAQAGNSVWQVVLFKIVEEPFTNHKWSAAELTFSGRVIDAEEALQLGLLLEIVEPDALLDRANAIATDFAAKPPQALRMTKRLMKAAQRLELGDLLDLSASYQANCHYTDDHQRAMSESSEEE